MSYYDSPSLGFLMKMQCKYFTKYILKKGVESRGTLIPELRRMLGWDV